jgi:glycosyltransferase involved in cell wall biosynthesis
MNRLKTTTEKLAAKNLFPKDLVCFSHLRWNFVYQRPQHLLSRFAKHYRVFFFEEPMFDTDTNNLSITISNENVWVVVPHLKGGMSPSEVTRAQKELIDSFFTKMELEKYILWYYTPMALEFTDHLKGDVTVYDCMDELAAFKFAPPSLHENEKKLLRKADVVFTGGQSLYEAKANCHKNIHPFPSSIDKEHFSRARLNTTEPADQASIPHPRMGFFGVVDERMNIDLVGQVAAQRPDWHFVIIGPVVKIDPATLPNLPNIHYLGGKSYQELPSYVSGWDIAMIPFALNESTKFISPTKTPEYLAAGKPVISTSIRDVVRPYGQNKLVHIADTAKEFIDCAERELKVKDKSKWLLSVDTFLKDNSWMATWKRMMNHISSVLEAKNIVSREKQPFKQEEKILQKAEELAIIPVQKVKPRLYV